MRRFREARDLDRKGDVRRAGEAYAQAERMGLRSPEFFTEYGSFRLRYRDPLEAESLFRRALERNSRYGPAHARLGEVYLRRELWELSAQEYAIAASLMPGRASELYVNAGNVYLGMKSLDRARDMFRAALAAEPGSPAAEEGLARVQAGTK